MKVLLTSVGTRGDMEPFLAIGEMLQSRGHEIAVLFPEQFRSLAENAELAFYSMGKEFIEMLDGEVGVAVLGGGGNKLQRFISMVKLGLANKKISQQIVGYQKKAFDTFIPDLVVHNPKAMYAYLWGLENPGKTIFVSPVPYLHYIRGHTHVSFNNNYGTWINRFTYKLAEFGLSKTILNTGRKMGIGKWDRKEIKNFINDERAIYTVSPTIYPGHKSLPDHVKVMGYQERDKQTAWKPDQALLTFLTENPKCLFITFGSMTNPEPDRKTQIILDILKRHKIPAIINTAAGGLIEPGEYDQRSIYFLQQIPYDWILPRVYAMIHHGGSGTTHLALKYGCPTMIIPHIIDQFVFNKIVREVGAGPLGIKIGKISIDKLEEKVLDLYNNPGYLKNAKIIREDMKKEDFEGDLCNYIVSREINNNK